MSFIYFAGFETRTGRALFVLVFFANDIVLLIRTAPCALRTPALITKRPDKIRGKRRWGRDYAYY